MVNSAKKSSSSISPSSPQLAIILCDFVLDGGGVTLHVLATQRGVVQHLAAPLRAGVEHHTLAEDRRHEGVRRGLVEILVGGTEEELVRVGAGEQDDVLVGQLEPADVTALVADPLHQPDRVGAELLEMAVFFFAAGDARHDRCVVMILASPLHRVRVRDVLLVVGQRRLGLKLHVDHEAAPGVSATNVMARARSAARRK